MAEYCVEIVVKHPFGRESVSASPSKVDKPEYSTLRAELKQREPGAVDHEDPLIHSR